jgi:hypothetical protein
MNESFNQINQLACRSINQIKQVNAASHSIVDWWLVAAAIK